MESTLTRFVAVEEEVGPEHVEASSSSSSPQQQQQQQQHAPVIITPQCCWSAWGDEAACGGYPTGSGGACNTDWAKACIADGDCPTLTVAPAVLTPPGGPDRPSPACITFSICIQCVCVWVGGWVIFFIFAV